MSTSATSLQSSNGDNSPPISQASKASFATSKKPKRVHTQNPNCHIPLANTSRSNPSIFVGKDSLPDCIKSYCVKFPGLLTVVLEEVCKDSSLRGELQSFIQKDGKDMLEGRNLIVNSPEPSESEDEEWEDESER
jgi:hypothetical protein